MNSAKYVCANSGLPLISSRFSSFLWVELLLRLAEPVYIVGSSVSPSMTMNLWWICTAGGPRFFCPVFGGGKVLSLLRSTELSSGRKPAGVAPGRKNEYASTFLSFRERLNSVTLICVPGLGLSGASPESERLFFFALGSEMLLSRP